MQRRGSASCAALLLAPALLTAQSLRGLVVDGSGAPVVGVVVQMTDSTATTVFSRVLSNARGEYRLVAPAAGSYRVRTLRIGFRPLVSDAVTLAAGQEVTQRLTVDGVVFALDTVRVIGRNSCRSFGDAGASTFAVWEQVRTALTNAQMTVGARSISATTVSFARTLEPDLRRVRDQRMQVRTDFVAQPWVGITPDSLHRVGYVTTDAENATNYYAPGFEVLLSDIFVTDHCFKLRRDDKRLGIEFEPAPERKDIADLRGTLWLDRATAELRRLEFRYVNVSFEQEDNARGEMDFVRMRDGGFAIARWSIRMPVLELDIRRGARNGAGTRITAIRFSGGELSLARRGADTLWSRTPLVVTGVVMDSLAGTPLRGAYVALMGTQLGAVSDDDGRFSMSGVIPGEYTVQVSTASLDSVGAIHQSTIAVTDGATPARIRVPTASQLAATLCGSTARKATGIVFGQLQGVRGASNSDGAEVTADWTEVTLGGASAPAPRHVSVRPNATGQFRVCDVPLGIAITIRASSDSSGADPLEIRIPPDGRFIRADVLLDKPAPAIGVFAGMVLADSGKIPIADVEVTFPDLARSATTNERGAFRIGEIPRGTHRVLARRFGYGPLDTKIEIGARQTVVRQILLSRVVTLNPVAVTERAVLPLFEEHRRMGLGQFLTREDLAKQEGRTMSAVLTSLRGLQIRKGVSNYAWVISNRGVRAGAGQATFDIFDLKKGAKPGCYAQVYIDRNMVYRARTASPSNPEPLFDINSIKVESIEAIEYYAGPSQTPMEYGGADSICGVLVIHTRRTP
ncbi:MAG: carboxypeptidase regulatory-like domain-containing protein [Gemmatimonadota bacterium]